MDQSDHWTKDIPSGLRGFSGAQVVPLTKQIWAIIQVSFTDHLSSIEQLYKDKVLSLQAITQDAPLNELHNFLGPSNGFENNVNPDDTTSRA